MLRLLWCLALLALMFAPAAAKDKNGVTDFNTFLQPGEHAGVMRVADRDRRFLIFTPDGMTGDRVRPIVFFFHGAGGSADQAAGTYGWVEKAKKEHFFAVFPEGLGVRPDAAPSFLLNPRIWRDERFAIPGQVDDVGFFTALLDKLQAVLPIDPHRVFVTGFSNGAAMTFTLGGHFSNRIAAIAPVSSQSFSSVDALARPLPVYYLVGTADPLIPYNGGSMLLWGQMRETPPVQQSADRWAQLDGCPPAPQVVSDKDGVRVVRYGPGRGHAEVVYTVITDNGHHWPMSPEPLPRVISGPTLDPFSATDRIWDFFRQHPLPN